MFIIHTERLSLCALSYEEAIQYSKNRNDFEVANQLAKSNLELSDENGFIEEFESSLISYTIPKLKDHPDDWPRFSHWLIVEKESKLTVGGIGNTGLPDAEGQTMIGYFIDKKYEGKGIATEAVSGFTKWLFEHPDQKSIFADTPVTNTGSQKVLQKSGFQFEGEVEEGYRWRIVR